MKTLDSRARGYLITIPRYYNDKKISFKDVYNMYHEYTYLCFQLEKGNESDYYHYQIYIENDTQIRFSTLKNKCNYSHIEERKGTKKQAYEYCTKSQTRVKGPFEYGIKPKFEVTQGTKKTLKAEFVADVLNKMTDYALLIKYPTIFSKKLVNEIREVANININVGNRDIEVTYIYGTTGTGKTRYYRNLHDENDIFVVNKYGTTGMFDGYNGQDVIVFEEFRSNIPITEMLQYIDIYPLVLPARFTNRQAKYTKVYIVSNWELSKQYSYLEKDDLKAFKRRIHKLINIETYFVSTMYFDNGKLINENIDYKMELFPF